MKKKVMIFENSQQNLISAYGFLGSLGEMDRPEIVFQAFVPEALKMITGGELSGVIADNVDLIEACHDRHIPCVLSVSPGDVNDAEVNARLEEIGGLLATLFGGENTVVSSPRDWPKLWGKLSQKM